MSGKFIPYGRHWIDKEDINSTISVLRSDFITQGPKVKEFEDKVANYCGAKYAVAVSSGTAALHIACLAADIKDGDEVITTPISFVASSNCVVYCGGAPVFADIDPETINIDPKQIKGKIGPRTKAIIPVHFGGYPCDLREIQEVAKRHNLIIIEDATHALGAEYRTVKIGSSKYSDMTVFSFHPVKHITTGEGGMVLTNRRDLYEKLIAFRNHGIIKDRRNLLKKNEGRWYYEMQFLGFNYRITDFQCALGISQLRKLERFIKRRRQIVNIYYRELSKLKGLELIMEKDYVKSAWHIYVIKIKKERRKIFDRLFKAGIGVNVHYRPIYLHPFYQRLGYREGLCPEAQRYYNEALTIPLHSRMTEEETFYIVNKIKESLS